MTTGQLIERMRDALIAGVEELEAFEPEDESTIDYMNQVLNEYGIWYRRHMMGGLIDA